MPQIRVDPEEVKRVAKDVKSKKDTMEDAINRAKSTMQQLQPNFTGKRSKRIFEEWEGMQPKLKDAMQTFLQASELLERAGVDFENTDNA
ncbi:MAG: WXG100 family type VII secretion target [Anaerolineales bacterium]|jgi:WXG100 family type VII secretion target